MFLWKKTKKEYKKIKTLFFLGLYHVKEKLHWIALNRKGRLYCSRGDTVVMTGDVKRGCVAQIELDFIETKGRRIFKHLSVLVEKYRST